MECYGIIVTSLEACNKNIIQHHQHSKEIIKGNEHATAN